MSRLTAVGQAMHCYQLLGISHYMGGARHIMDKGVKTQCKSSESVILVLNSGIFWPYGSVIGGF